MLGKRKKKILPNGGLTMIFTLNMSQLACGYSKHGSEVP